MMMKTIISDTEERWLAPEEWPLVGQREGGRGEGGEREKAGLMVSKILLLLTTTMMMICSRSRCSALSLGKKRKEKKTALVVVVVEKRCAGLRANCHVLCVCVCVCVSRFAPCMGFLTATEHGVACCLSITITSLLWSSWMWHLSGKRVGREMWGEKNSLFEELQENC